MKVLPVVFLLMMLAGSALAGSDTPSSLPQTASSGPIVASAAVPPTPQAQPSSAALPPKQDSAFLEIPSAGNGKCLPKIILASTPTFKCYASSDDLCPFFCQDGQGKYCSNCNCPRGGE